MISTVVEKTEEELRQEINELLPQQRQISERLRSPPGFEREGLSDAGPRNFAANVARQSGLVRPITERLRSPPGFERGGLSAAGPCNFAANVARQGDPVRLFQADGNEAEDQPPAKRRLLSGVVKVEDGETIENDADKEQLAEEGNIKVGNVSDKRPSNIQQGGWSRRDGTPRKVKKENETLLTEHMPGVFPMNEGPSFVSINKRMREQLLGTLEVIHMGPGLPNKKNKAAPNSFVSTQLQLRYRQLLGSVADEPSTPTQPEDHTPAPCEPTPTPRDVTSIPITHPRDKYLQLLNMRRNISSQSTSQEMPPAYNQPPVNDTILPSISATSTSTAGSTTDPKKTRGVTKGHGLAKINKAIGKRLEIEISPTKRRPTNSIQSAKLSSEIGMVSRTSLPVRTKWKKITNEELDIAFDKLDQKLEVKGIRTDNEVHAIVKKFLSLRSKDQRFRLKKHYTKHGKDVKPHNVTVAEWMDLCEYWEQSATKEKSEKAKLARSQVKCRPNSGSKAFVAIQHEISDKDEEECDRIKLYDHTHYDESKGQWTTTECKEKWELMCKELIDSIEQGHLMTEDEVYNKVLGTRSDYVVGMGVGPRPQGKTSVRKRLQDELEESKKVNQKLQSQVDELNKKVEQMQDRLTTEVEQQRIEFEQQKKLLELLCSTYNIRLG